MTRALVCSRAAALCALAAVACPVAAGAQVLPALEQYHVRTFEAADGLPAADVIALMQGADGYLYVGNGRGLVRFDGHEFHRIDLDGFTSSIVTGLHMDARDRLWIVSGANDLGYLEHGRVHAVGRTDVRLDRFTAHSDGSVWFGTYNGIVRAVAGEQPAVTHFTRADGIPADSVNGVFELREGVFGATSQQAFRIVKDPRRRGGVRFIPIGPRYRTIEDTRVDSAGLWVAVRDSAMRPLVIRIRKGQADVVRPGDTTALFPWTRDQIAAPRASVGWHTHFAVELDSTGRTDSSIHYIMPARDGTQWMSGTDAHTRSVLMRVRGNQIDTIPLSSYFDVRRVRHLVEDHEGSIWVGTDRGLLQLWSRKVFALTTRQGLAESFTTAIVQTRDSAIWIGSYGGGLHRFAHGRLTHRFTTGTGLPRNDVRAVYEAKDGTLWVGLLEGYASIRGTTVSESVVTDAEVRAFAETPDGSLWLGTGNNLLVRRAGGSGFRPHDREFWRDKSIWALHAARNGDLWIGTERGLFRLVDGMLESMDDGQGLRGRFVVSIYEERDGTLWFGTYEHGLYRRRGDRFTRVTSGEGLHHDGIWRVLEDDRGGMWMSSDQGVFRLDRASLHAVADAVERGERTVTPLRPLVFTETEGMPNRESNRGSPGGSLLYDGRLVFNNIGGVIVIDAVHATRLPPPPRTALQQILIDGHAQGFTLAAPSRVKAGTRQLIFEYAALSFVAPNQNRYRYRVDGYDDAWVETGSQRRATYTNLPPGDYVFRVQGATGTGPWSEPGVAQAFTVAPFLWQTWWFRTAALLLLALALAAAHRYRVQRALELERLRLRIAADLHDDVGSTLSSIALLTDMLQAREQLDDREQVQLRRIHRAASDAIDALRDVIWIVDPKHTTLADLLARMRRVAADMLAGTSWTFDSARSSPERVLDMTFMRMVLLIYKESLHNIATHAHASNVRITIVDADGVFDLRIEDDGAGFDETSVRRGRGLDSMRRRAQLANARLEIESESGRGTRINLCVDQKVHALR